MLRAASIAGLALTAALAACGGGDGGDDGDNPPSEGKSDLTTSTIDIARAAGRRAVATSTGSVRAPTAIRLRVSARPKQRVSVVWGVACARRSNLAKRPVTSGAYVTTPPDARALKLPAKSAALCAVSARARLRGTGRVRVTVTATAPRR